MIDEAIGVQAFEIIRDRIGEILANELPSQSVLNSNPDLNVPIWIERFIPFDKEELPAINVSLLNGNYDGETPITTDGSYIFTIDVFEKAKSFDNAGTIEYGDKKSMLKLHRLAGVCRSILMNSLYLTLGFARGFIARRKINSLNVAQPGDQDGTYTSMLRFEMLVKATESTIEEKPIDAEGYDTSWTINETDKGFKFTINN